MRIGFDAKRAFLNRTGLGNYSRWLIGSLAKYQPQNQYYLYTPRINQGVKFPLNPGLVTKKPILKFSASLWRSKGVIRDLKRDGIELYHGLSHELPLGIQRSGIKSVVTVHDVIILRFPEYFSWINRTIYKAKLKYACRIADHIIAISQKTKDDLIELLNVDETKIEVIYQSCDQQFREKVVEADKGAVKQKYNLPDSYLLNVGTIEQRKNLLLLVKALKHVPEIPLVVVGKPTPYLDQVKAYLIANKLKELVIFLHDVRFEDLPAIYQQAMCFIYPSRYEGFGLPVLEAISSGVPAIAASGSCLEEAGGASSLYVNPDDESDLAEKINQVLTDTALRQKMITHGLAYSLNFADEKLAAQYAALYQNILQHA